MGDSKLQIQFFNKGIFSRSPYLVSMSNFQAWYNVSIFASLYSSEYQGYSLEKHAHLPFRKSMTRFQNHKGDSIRKKSWVYLSASDPMSSPTEKIPEMPEMAGPIWNCGDFLFSA